MSTDQPHVTSGIRKILELPFVYNTFQTITGGNRDRDKLFQTYFNHESIQKVLDIGCGSGVLLKSLRTGVEYHGCDMEKKYIDYCRKTYGDRGTFYQEIVGEHVREEWVDYFDVVNAHGLLHHLTNQDCETLLATGYKYLKPGGFMLTVDTTYYKGMNALSRWLVSKDRGQNIKSPDEFQAMASKFFNKIDGKLIKNSRRFPYPVYVMKMTK
jgi:2-polyprenyl-3-methyl-5-hydroxy-6-metoxy-1,4-benzoquinol methylase